MQTPTRHTDRQSLLGQLGVVPFTTSVLSSLLGEFEQRNHKISRMERAGDIIRLKRSMYVVSPLISHQTLSTELIANHLYAPSYLSCLTALRYIPGILHLTRAGGDGAIREVCEMILGENICNRI